MNLMTYDQLRAFSRLLVCLCTGGAPSLIRTRTPRPIAVGCARYCARLRLSALSQEQLWLVLSAATQHQRRKDGDLGIVSSNNVSCPMASIVRVS